MSPASPSPLSCPPCRRSSPPLPGPVAPPLRPARLNGISHHVASSPPDVTPHPPSRQLGPGLSGMVDAYMARRPWSARYTDARPPSATYIPIRERVAQRVPRLQHPWPWITGRRVITRPRSPVTCHKADPLSYSSIHKETKWLLGRHH